jgi:hypothetical protein
MLAWHPVVSEEIGGRWEQFYDCFLPVTARKWCPTTGSRPTRRFIRRKLILGMFLYWWIPSSVWDLVKASCLIWYSLCLSKGRNAFGRLQVEAPWACDCELTLYLCQIPMDQPTPTSSMGAEPPLDVIINVTAWANHSWPGLIHSFLPHTFRF